MRARTAEGTRWPAADVGGCAQLRDMCVRGSATGAPSEGSSQCSNEQLLPATPHDSLERCSHQQPTPMKRPESTHDSAGSSVAFSVGPGGTLTCAASEQQHQQQQQQQQWRPQQQPTLLLQAPRLLQQQQQQQQQSPASQQQQQTGHQMVPCSCSCSVPSDLEAIDQLLDELVLLDASMRRALAGGPAVHYETFAPAAAAGDSLPQRDGSPELGSHVTRTFITGCEVPPGPEAVACSTDVFSWHRHRPADGVSAPASSTAGKLHSIELVGSTVGAAAAAAGACGQLSDADQWAAAAAAAHARGGSMLSSSGGGRNHHRSVRLSSTAGQKTAQLLSIPQQQPQSFDIEALDLQRPVPSWRDLQQQMQQCRQLGVVAASLQPQQQVDQLLSAAAAAAAAAGAWAQAVPPAVAAAGQGGRAVGVVRPTTGQLVLQQVMLDVPALQPRRAGQESTKSSSSIRLMSKSAPWKRGG